ncbi:MAG TPA: nucleotidyl transferase AbiEii/AbiGii toxin family protein [Chitinophagales bacterium]|nr:nucleotidyl transferase AbiEii/AbiGii toxin family protein [Chitinophagales bacterium]
MFNITEIEKFYPPQLSRFKAFLLREYLQYKVLEIIFNTEHASKFCFLGGTSIRIVHNSQRFSEDIDFDNLGLTAKNFEQVAAEIKKMLTAEGYRVEVNTVLKGAWHCHLRFPGLLFQEGLSGHRDQVILISIDIEPQEFKFKPGTFLINKFDVFTEIFVTPPSILLSQKLLTLLHRKRSKGRDFFDVVFLLSSTKPDYRFLKQKAGIETPSELRAAVLKRCSNIDMKQMAKDVEPFLFNAKDANKISLFPKFLEKVEL